MLRPSIIKKDYFGENLFDELFREFPFEDHFDRKIEKELYGRRANHIMKTDVKECDDEYELTIDLPGFKKDEIKVSLNDGYLTIEASKGHEKDEKDKKSGQYIRQERYSGCCSRSFYVGENVDEASVTCKFEHGLLTIHVPKKAAEPAVEEHKYIQIEG